MLEYESNNWTETRSYAACVGKTIAANGYALREVPREVDPARARVRSIAPFKTHPAVLTRRRSYADRSCIR